MIHIRLQMRKHNLYGVKSQSLDIVQLVLIKIENQGAKTFWPPKKSFLMYLTSEEVTENRIYKSITSTTVSFSCMLF